MKIDKKELYHFLSEKGTDYLYHANTVTTSVTFLEQGGLMSRGAVERKGLKQTEQRSDNTDKRYNVWNDIFLDAYDIHLGGCENGGKTYYRENFYGPILFKLRKELLLDNNLPEIWITRDNPTEWSKLSLKPTDAYINLDKYKEMFGEKTYKRMITIKTNDYIIDFNDYLEEIIIDDGVEVNGVNYSQTAYNTIVNNSNINCNITMRNCKYNCYCITNYNTYSKNDLERLFSMQ